MPFKRLTPLNLTLDDLDEELERCPPGAHGITGPHERQQLLDNTAKTRKRLDSEDGLRLWHALHHAHAAIVEAEEVRDEANTRIQEAEDETENQKSNVEDLENELSGLKDEHRQLEERQMELVKERNDLEDALNVRALEIAKLEARIKALEAEAEKPR